MVTCTVSLIAMQRMRSLDEAAAGFCHRCASGGILLQTGLRSAGTPLQSTPCTDADAHMQWQHSTGHAHITCCTAEGVRDLENRIILAQRPLKGINTVLQQSIILPAEDENVTGLHMHDAGKHRTGQIGGLP